MTLEVRIVAEHPELDAQIEVTTSDGRIRCNALSLGRALYAALSAHPVGPFLVDEFHTATSAHGVTRDRLRRAAQAFTDALVGEK